MPFCFIRDDLPTSNDYMVEESDMLHTSGVLGGPTVTPECQNLL